MTYNHDIHKRRSIRLKDYDYSQEGAYFVTMCTWNRECIFGEIRDGEIILNEYGRIVQNEWVKTADIRPNAELDYHVIMPNHFHGILMMDKSGRGTACRARNEYDDNMGYKGTARRAPTVEQFAKPVAGSLPTIIRSFKSAVTKAINTIRNTHGQPIWQRNYYEHIIRDENELHAIRQYISENPLKWDMDNENPTNKSGTARHTVHLQFIKFFYGDSSLTDKFAEQAGPEFVMLGDR